MNTHSPVAPAPPAHAAYMIERLRRRRTLAAGIALGVSAALHVVALWRLPDITVLTRLRMAPPRRLQVTRVREFPDLARTPVEPVRQLMPAAGAGAARADAGTPRPLDEALIEPRRAPEAVALETRPPVTAAAPEARPVWDARQDVLRMDRDPARVALDTAPRRLDTPVPVAPGPDILPPATVRDTPSVPVAQALPVLPGASEPRLSVASLFDSLEPLSRAGAGRGEGPGGAPAERPPLDEAAPRAAETVTPAVPGRQALDNFLTFKVTPVLVPGDREYGYCRIAIERAGPDILPVLPRDVVFVQDASASLTENRLYFCRDGLVNAFATLGPNDRFNVLAFSDTVRRCFDDWATPDPAALARATAFVRGLRSEGATDFYKSVSEVLALPTDPARPLVTVLISDGLPTTGLTDSSKIIEAFSRAANGRVSVFALGTFAGANAYLLDLFSFRNRGDQTIVQTGRWDIPGAIEAVAWSVRRPVLSDVQFRFVGDTAVEAYPERASNLYLDRPMVLHARYPLGTRKLVLQAAGRAGEREGDMVFELDVGAPAPKGDPSIARDWAWQRIYHLIGEHLRTRDPLVLRDLRAVAARYGLKVPYESELGP